MKITIGIPCYNQAEFLPDAIESALEQTVPCEVIVVNDGSPDATKDIAKRYSVKVINQTNRGLSAARNTAIMNMTGDYFLPLDADDMLLPLCVERMLEAIEKHTTDVVSPSFKTFGVENAPFVFGNIPSLEDFKTANRIPYFSAIKKEALLEVGGYSSRMVHGWEDYALWFDLFKRGKTLCVIREILVLYRTKEHSMIHDANAHSKELWEQIYKDHGEIFTKD